MYLSSIVNLIHNIESTNRWYISGTPFNEYLILKACCEFIGVSIVHDTYNLSYDFAKKQYYNNILSDAINNNLLWDVIIDNFYIKHTKKDVINQIHIPNFNSEIKWIELTDNEKKMYELKKSTLNNTEQLQKLCCHPIIY